MGIRATAGSADRRSPADRLCCRGLALRKNFQGVEGAQDATATSVEDVGIDHRRFHTCVAKELLDGPNVVAVHQEVCGK